MRVLEAADGRTGIDLAQKEQPNAILLDVMMPGMDGWAVAEQLLRDERTAEIPIIFLTARADLRDRARGMDLGGLEYMTKPFNPDELARIVQEVVAAVERGARGVLRTEG